MVAQKKWSHMIKESEAREKWCPFVRIAHIKMDANFATSSAFNRVVVVKDGKALQIEEFPYTCKCIASSCMMWRNDYCAPGTGYCGLSGNSPMPSGIRK